MTSLIVTHCNSKRTQGPTMRLEIAFPMSQHSLGLQNNKEILLIDALKMFVDQGSGLYIFIHVAKSLLVKHFNLYKSCIYILYASCQMPETFREGIFFSVLDKPEMAALLIWPSEWRWWSWFPSFMIEGFKLQLNPDRHFLSRIHTLVRKLYGRYQKRISSTTYLPVTKSWESQTAESGLYFYKSLALCSASVSGKRAWSWIWTCSWMNHTIPEENNFVMVRWNIHWAPLLWFK